MTIRVLLADDHGMFRAGLRALLHASPDIQVAGEAATGLEALEILRETPVDVVCMDVLMPDMNGIEAARQLLQRRPDIRILILSMQSSMQHVHFAFAAGVLGYLLKEAPGEELVTAVRTVFRGERYICSRLREMIRDGDDLAGASPLDSLSPRERQVLQLVAEGKTSAEIAGIVHLSPKSIDTYRSRLMKKLQIDDIASLVKFAISHGVTPG